VIDADAVPVSERIRMAAAIKAQPGPETMVSDASLKN